MDVQKLHVDLAKAKQQLAAAEGADEKAFAKQKIADIEAKINLENRHEGTPHAHAGKKKDKKTTKPKTNKVEITPDPFEHEGKIYVFGVDHDYCDVLRQLWHEREIQSEKSQHKYKTKSLNLKIADGIKHPIKHVIDNISATEISKNPKRLLVKLRSLKKNAKALLEDCKSLAPQLTQKDINGSISVIEDMIEEIEEAISGEKKVDGGVLEKKYGTDQNYTRRANQIIGKLIESGAKDLSNEEIDRVFKQTVVPVANIKFAKKLRDDGFITIETIKEEKYF